MDRIIKIIAKLNSNVVENFDRRKFIKITACSGGLQTYGFCII
jgi:hypothetical protein